MSEPRPLRFLPGYLFGRGAFALLALLPTPMSRAAGRLLGRLFFHLSARHRHIALRNIESALGQRLDPPRRRQVAIESFEHLGTLAADAPRFPHHARTATDRQAVHEGVDHLRAALALGRGALVFSGHYGHWELVALLQARLGMPMTMVVSPMRNPWFDRYFLRLRGLSGNTVLSKRHAARPILKALREGRPVAILIDQNVRGEGGLFVDFFGRAASTTPSLATLAFRSGAPLVPVFSHFRPDGRLQIAYGEALHPVRQGALEDDIRDLMQRCTAILEQEIERRPGSWLWMHDRWRTRPRPESSGARVAAEARG